jgi:hypothetical protein
MTEKSARREREAGLSGPGLPGTLHGRPTRRIETAHCWIECLSEGGPRIVGFGLAGGPNVFAETPDSRWDMGYGTFELVGGHRLWFAPESPECSFPDATGLEVAPLEGGVSLTGAVQTPTALRKSMEVTLSAGSAAVHVRHVIRNEGPRTLDLAAWAITQLRLGGTARVELPGPSHGSTPTQLVVLWPYTSWSEERLSIRDGELSVAGKAGEPMKVGCLNYTGRVVYEHDEFRFTKTYDPALTSPHTDLGCNLEIYVDRGTIEVESLGPLVRLAPGNVVSWDEGWELQGR